MENCLVADSQSDPAVVSKSEGPTPRLAINLFASQDGTFEVRSCEIIGDGYRNRTSFQKKASLDEVFVNTVADALGACLRDLSLSNGVVSLPDFKIESPGLALGGVHILISEQDGGNASILLRFRVFFGSLDALLCKTGEHFACGHPPVDKVAAEVLFDIMMPVLNICSASNLGQLVNQDMLQAHLANLVESTEDLRFRCMLLQRFLDGACHEDTAVRPSLPAYKLSDPTS